MKSFFININHIDEVFTALSDVKPYELGVTVFYYDDRNRDKEWTFFLNLN